MQRCKSREVEQYHYSFDNNQYSIIHGYYDGEENLGERWNGEEDTIGFPSTRVPPMACCSSISLVIYS